MGLRDGTDLRKEKARCAALTPRRTWTRDKDVETNANKDCKSFDRGTGLQIPKSEGVETNANKDYKSFDRSTGLQIPNSEGVLICIHNL
jgi:hypothetical protein